MQMFVVVAEGFVVGYVFVEGALCKIKREREKEKFISTCRNVGWRIGSFNRGVSYQSRAGAERAAHGHLNLGMHHPSGQLVSVPS